MARALPFVWAALYLAAALLAAWFEHVRLVSIHSYTAASYALAGGAVLALIAAALGWLLGWALRELTVPETPKERPALVALVIIVLSCFTVASLTVGRSREARLEALRLEVLTPDRARALAASRNPREIVALAWNRSAPPDLLRRLAANPDYGVRANVAANPATPADVARKLALDENETVRLYAESHPSRRK